MSCESVHEDGRLCTIPGRHDSTHGYQTDDGQWVFWIEEVRRISTRREPTTEEMMDIIHDVVQPIRLHQGGQQSQFDPEAVAANRQRGITDSDDHADPQWKIDADDAIERVARRMEFFTADEIWEELAQFSTAQTPNPSALGPRFLDAGKRGVIVKTTETERTKIPRRHRDLTVWRSLTFCGRGVDYTSVTH